MKKIIVFATLLVSQFVIAGNVICDDSQAEWISEFDRTGRASSPVYNPSGKPDPFQPIFSEGLSKAAPTILQSDCISNPVLEKLSLSQLQLTGIVLTERQSVALVQEANGKGHVITEEMCIGIHGGKVAEILNDRIIVQSAIQDVSGDVKVKKTEMKLKGGTK